MDQGFEPRPFAIPATFLYLSAPNFLNQNVKNRKCPKTRRTFHFCGRPIRRLWLSLQPTFPPGKALLTQRVSFSFPSPRQDFLLEWPRKIKANNFPRWGPLMNSCCWGSNELLHAPLLSESHYHQEAQSKGTTWCQIWGWGHTGIFLFWPWPKQVPLPGYPFCSSSRFHPLIYWKAPSFSWRPRPTEYTWRFAACVSQGSW